MALINEHQNEYASPYNLSILLQDGSRVDKNVKDSLIFMESQLAQYAQWKNPATINNIFYNYINSVYGGL